MLPKVILYPALLWKAWTEDISSSRLLEDVNQSLKKTTKVFFYCLHPTPTPQQVLFLLFVFVFAFHFEAFLKGLVRLALHSDSFINKNKALKLCCDGGICGQEAFPDGSEGRGSVCNAGDTGDTSSIPESGRSSGEGNGNPLQYSCLESPMDRRAWRAMVSGVKRSQTQLND